MQDQFKQATKEAQAIYNPWVLRIYDIVVTHISNRFIWQCPASNITALYAKHTKHNHLDIGVGSGHYLKQMRSQKSINIDLMDLNSNALQYTKKRCQLSPQSQLYCHDIFEPLPDKCLGHYESVGMNYLLHCIPGHFGDQKRQAIQYASLALKEGGVLFGSTIINADQKSSNLAHKLMTTYNQKGIFNNTTDTQEGLKEALESALKAVEIKRIGSVVLFKGVRP